MSETLPPCPPLNIPPEFRTELGLLPAPDLARMDPTHIKFYQLTELIEEAPPDWVWRGLLAKARTTMIIGHPKAGKTTLISHLIKALASTQITELATAVRPARTLLITEEHSTHWVRRRNHLNITDPNNNIWICCPPPFHTLSAWHKFGNVVSRFCAENNIETVIFDTVSSLWACEDENSAVSVKDSFAPISKLRDQGVAVLLMHHSGKSDREWGLAARGSTAFNQFVDIVIDFRRLAKSSNLRRRLLKFQSREPDSPQSLILEWLPEDAGYKMVAIDEDEDVMDGLFDAQILGGLPMSPPGITALELSVRTQLSQSAINSHLPKLIEKQRVTYSGKGVKGDPKTYFKF